MGGQEGARGYLYQAFATSLKSLCNNDWDQITIEFETPNDKVDIAIATGDKIIEAIQVKSSVNLFGRNSILKWLEELVDDYAAEVYTLYLIGNCDKESNVLIKSINKLSKGISDKESVSALEEVNEVLLVGNVRIEVMPFNLAVLEAIVRDATHNYISKKSGVVEYEGLHLIAQGINMTFMLLSTSGKALGREEFERKIYEWLSLSLGSYLKSISTKADHQLYFYDRNNGKLVSEITALKFLNYYGYQYEFNRLMTNGDKLIDSIEAINLKSAYEDETESTSVGEATLFENVGFGQLLGRSDKIVQLMDEEIEDKINEIEKIHNRKVSKSFFHVGKLREVRVNNLLENSYEYVGSDEEKKKQELLDSLYYNLLDLMLLEGLIEVLKNFVVVPLTISNTSNHYDEDVVIKVKIPRSVTVVNADSVITNDYIEHITDCYCESDGILDRIFRFKGDGKVNIDNSRGLDLRMIEPPVLIMPHNGNSNRYSTIDFKRILGNYINQNVLAEEEEEVVLEYKVSTIKPKEIVKLRSLLLITEPSSNFNISYSILSKNTKGDITGSLTIISESK